jgi:hypothetical protein
VGRLRFGSFSASASLVVSLGAFTKQKSSSEFPDESRRGFVLLDSSWVLDARGVSVVPVLLVSSGAPVLEFTSVVLLLLLLLPLLLLVLLVLLVLLMLLMLLRRSINAFSRL